MPTVLTLSPRTVDLPTTMSPLPTTAALGLADAPTLIPSAQVKTADDTAFRVTGFSVIHGADPTFISQTNAFNNGTFIYSNGPVCFEWTHTGRIFDVQIQGNAQSFRVLANDRVVHSTVSVTTPNTGSWYRYLVDFGSTDTRQIRLEAASGFKFGGGAIGAGETISAPVAARTHRAVFIGDSITEGVGASDSFLGFSLIASRLLGWGFPYVAGSGGTGYIEPGLYATLQNRLPEMALSTLQPTEVVIALGLNDMTRVINAGNDATAVQTAAALALSTISTQAPSATLYTVGPLHPHPGKPVTDATLLAIRSAIRTASLANNASFIDPFGGLTDPWITGTGKVGAPTGDGNADIYISSDGTHPSTAGHEYYGRKVTNGVFGLVAGSASSLSLAARTGSSLTLAPR